MWPAVAIARPPSPTYARTNIPEQIVDTATDQDARTSTAQSLRKCFTQCKEFPNRRTKEIRVASAAKASYTRDEAPKLLSFAPRRKRPASAIPLRRARASGPTKGIVAGSASMRAVGRITAVLSSFTHDTTFEEVGEDASAKRRAKCSILQVLRKDPDRVRPRREPAVGKIAAFVDDVLALDRDLRVALTSVEIVEGAKKTP